MSQTKITHKTLLMTCGCTYHITGPEEKIYSTECYEHTACNGMMGEVGKVDIHATREYELIEQIKKLREELYELKLPLAITSRNNRIRKTAENYTKTRDFDHSELLALDF